MVSYIATLGLSPKAVINSVWAAIDRGVKIEELVLFGTDASLAESLPAIKKALPTFAPDLVAKIETVEIPEESIIPIMRAMMELIKDRRRKGMSVWIDITGGRKTMSSAALITAFFADVSYASYFWLKDMSKVDLYYPDLDERDYEYVILPIIGIPRLDEYRSALGKLEVGPVKVADLEKLGIDLRVIRRLEHHGYVETAGDKIRITELGRTLMRIL